MASIPGVSGDDERNQEGGGWLEELKGSVNVVKATSASHRTPITGDVSLIEWLTAFVDEAIIPPEVDGWSLGSAATMGNSGFNV